VEQGHDSFHVEGSAPAVPAFHNDKKNGVSFEG
jgi:hypothetical protein